MTLPYKKTKCIIKRNNIKNNADVICLNCFHSFRTKDKLQLHEKICKYHDHCNVKGLKKTIKY